MGFAKYHDHSQLSTRTFETYSRYMNNHVSPAELDDILQAHPGVAECMVFGLPDPKVQELFSAAVVLKAEHKKVCSFVLIMFSLEG